MQRTKPPYRADQVGSFLRSEPLKEARAKREKGAITAAELKAVEDREIEISARRVLTFRPSQVLKNALNSSNGA